MEVRLDGITLSYDLTGAGPEAPIVQLHALGLNRHLWDEVAGWLGRRARVVAVDLRGHGESSKPPGPGAAYTFDDYVADVRGLVERLGLGRIRLMGLSIGGMIAQRFAADYPELVEALVLVDTSSDLGDEARQLQLERATLIEREGVAGQVESSKPRWFTPAAIERSLPAIEQASGWLRNTDRFGYAASCRALATWRFTEQLHKIRCPTLVVVGDQDPGTPPAHARVIHEHVRGSQLAVIPGASHLSPLEQPTAFRDVVERFLDSVKAR